MTHQRKLSGHVLSQAEEDRRLSLHAMGMTDSEISRATGRVRETISCWRASRGLAANYVQGRLPDHEQAARLALYRAGKSDNQIARERGVSQAAITLWRSRQSLAPNFSRPRSSLGGSWCAVGRARQAKAKRALWDAGKTDQEISVELGIRPDGIARWRRSQGLTANGDKACDPRRFDRRMNLYLSGLSDPEIARRENVDRTAIGQWRRHRQLSPNFPRRSPSGSNDYVLPQTEDARLLGRVVRAVGYGAPVDIRADAVGEICLALAAGRLEPTAIESQATKFVRRVMAEYASKFGPRSIDAILTSDGFALMEVLPDERSSDWLEEMGATVW